MHGQARIFQRMVFAGQRMSWAIAAGLVVGLSALPAAGQTSSSQTQPGQTQVRKTKPAVAPAATGLEQRLAPALGLLRAGNTDAGIKALTAELAKAGADADAVAVILFHRGVAQARAGRHTTAIADLSQALHKKRLTSEQRAEALLARGGAYAAAGLKDRAKRDFAEAGAFDAPPAGEPASPAVMATAPASADGNSAAAPAWETVAEAVPAKSEPKQQAQAPDTIGWQPDVAPALAKPVASPEAAPVSAKAGAGPVEAGQPSVADFFAGLWGGSPAPPAETPAVQPAPVMSATPAASASVASLAADPGAWSSTVSATDATDTVSPLAPPAAKTGGAKPARGTLLRLGALRSPQEAALLAETVRAAHGGIIGDLPLDVAPVMLGNMGRFYEVTAGPVPAKKGPEKLCQRLQSAGVDCLVVTR
jgi:hypothetical protein